MGRKVMRSLAISLVWLAVISPANADVAIVGIGSRTCAQVAQQYQVNPESAEEVGARLHERI